MTESRPDYVFYSWIAGQVLARRRQALRVGQVEMARALGTSQATWSRVESGISPLTIEQLSHAAELLGLHATDVMAEVDEYAERYREQGIPVLYHRTKEPPNVAAMLAAGLGAYGLIKVLSSSDRGED